MQKRDGYSWQIASAVFGFESIGGILNAIPKPTVPVLIGLHALQVLLLSECMLAVIRAHKADVKAERAATADCAAEKMPTDTPAVSGTATAEGIGLKPG